MWERTLQDLIRGLRANKKDESKFIAQAVDEIRQEIKSKDMELKAAAVLKLTYLEMLGYDMSWAAFHVVEVMSIPKTHLKTVGYLAAAQSFGPDTDVLMLTTNLVKKDLSSSPADIAVTLNGLASIMTVELARDMSLDLIAMLNHSRPHIRKRAILVMYKVLVKYPDVKDKVMPRLRERLEDTDAGVVAATVNVLCELARRNPQDYLPVAPQFFRLLTTSSNNWMLIKLVKIFGSLSPFEPRLVKKLQPPITELISTTPAISLLYECVHTCIIGGMLQGPSGNSLARLCVSKLATFLQDVDQNLKYIALLALTKIVPTHPHLVAEYQDVILGSVADQDISIRMRALDLVSAMVNRSNLQSIVQRLLDHLTKPETTIFNSAAQSLAQVAGSRSTTSSILPLQSKAYRLALAQRIISICSESTYANVTDFEWYLSVLVDLIYVASVDVGTALRDQLMDVVARVRGARRYAVQLMAKVLADKTLLLNARDENSCSDALWAAAWIAGEYCSEMPNPSQLLEYLLQPETLALSSDTITIYLHSAAKVFGHWAAELGQRWDDAYLQDLNNKVRMIVDCAKTYASNKDMEVQERAANLLGLFTFIEADMASYRPAKENSTDFGGDSSSGFNTDTAAEPSYPKSLYLLQPLFTSYELNTVATDAQDKVLRPEGLDLDAWIVAPPNDPVTEVVVADVELSIRPKTKKKKGKGKEKVKSKEVNVASNGTYEEGAFASQLAESPEEVAERAKRKAERLERLRDDPYYLIDEKSPSQVPDVDTIPIVKLDGMSEPSNTLQLTSLMSLRAGSANKTYDVDREGEAPTISRLHSSHAIAELGAAPLTSVDYDTVADVSSTASPTPIQVTRVKKARGAGKKKRTPKGDQDTTVR
ncbi:Adaptor protein complex AP-3 delta subunit [Neolentinus lepideus HHB14362 ss-1]|uniref:AP-3 complex subunit delta n=1 Tax=Neolentinus lepideus HHB14362 ss-1 TaxID=1314782 RepID=A0A165U415_9AGAM|nr:Adaptor protein complex AP-3 delta subunit [Neolentinus lepideus HHB14362 ss-1]